MTEENTSAGPAWTAGPWRVGADLTGICIGWPGEEDSLSPECFSKNGYAKTIAKVTHSPWADVTEHVANARLISAAPDLYGALERCALVLAGEVSHKSGLVDALEAARAALTKARGQ